MTEEEIQALIDDHDDYFLKFDQIPTERRLSNRHDLNAFMLLDKIVPGTSDIVSAAEHDEIYLEVTVEDLAKAGATEEMILDLIRSGVREGEYGGLAMFV